MAEQKGKASLGISAEAKGLFDALKEELGYASADEAVRELVALAKRDAVRIANPRRAGDLDELARLTAAINERAAAMVASSALEAGQLVQEAEGRAAALEERVRELEESSKRDRDTMAALRTEKQLAEAEARRASGLEEQVEALKAQIAEHDSLEAKLTGCIDLTARVKELEGQLALAQREIELLREFAATERQR